MTYTDLPLGVDVSRFQVLIDFDKLAARRPAVEFFACRATVSWGYVDGFFARNFQEAKRVGFPRFPYHVVYPAEDAARQTYHFLKTVEDAQAGEPELGYVLDCELDHGAAPSRILDCIYNHTYLIEKEKGEGRVVIYSRTSWINQFLAPVPSFKTWQNEMDWWLALYLKDERYEHPGPLVLPAGLKPERAIIHQTTGGFYSDGFGVQSKEIDINRWLRGREHLQRYGLQTAPEPPPAGGTTGGTLTLEQRIDILEKEARQKGWNV